MSPLTPLVDTNSLLAIETAFSFGERDPWGTMLAARFADLFIYADSFRFTVTSSSGASGDDLFANAPPLVRILRSRDSEATAPQLVPNEPAMRVHDDFVDDALRRFAAWAQNDRSRLIQWLDTHFTRSVEAMQAAQVAREYYFNIEYLRGKRDLSALTKRLAISQTRVLYAFDNFLRAPLYGKLAGDDQHYFNHPMRNAALLPTFEAGRGKLPRVCVSFKKSVAALIDNEDMTLDEYCALLHELRATIRGRAIHLLPPGALDKETLRELAASVPLPPRLRSRARAAGVATALLSGLAAVPILGVGAT